MGKKKKAGLETKEGKRRCDVLVGDEILLVLRNRLRVVGGACNNRLGGRRGTGSRGKKEKRLTSASSSLDAPALEKRGQPSQNLRLGRRWKKLEGEKEEGSNSRHKGRQ